MKPIEYTEDMVRQLKGAPISVLVLLIINRQPVSAQYIERWTGYSDKNVLAALQLLNEKGLITRNGRYAWQLSAEAMQLPLANLLPDPDSQGDDSAPEPASQDDAETTTTRKFRDGISPTPSSSRSLNPVLELEVKDQPPLLEPDSEKFRVSQNLVACDEAGIHEPKRSILSKLPHVTPPLIRYHVQSAPNIALAIYRIGKNWRIEPGWNDPLPESVKVVFHPERTGVCAQTLPEEAVQTWRKTRAALEKRLKRVEFETWLAPIELVGFDAETGYTLQACNQFGGEWVIRHALEMIRAELSAPVEVIWAGKDKK